MAVKDNGKATSMAIRTLTFALAAAAMTVGVSAQATAVPTRSSAPVAQAEGLGGSEFIPVAIFMLAILAIMLFDGDGDDAPASP
jgi:hypothetical protein